MLVVRVGFLTSNLVTQLGKVLGELTKTTNDQCNIPPLYAIRLYWATNPLGDRGLEVVFASRSIVHLTGRSRVFIPF